MLISLHKQATTTPKNRAAIQASDAPAWVLAERYGISEQTVWKWRKRDGVHDFSHTPHRLQTTLTPAQEAVAVVLRRTLLLPLDDLLSVVREFLNPKVSRSGLDRCLRRHGVSRLQDLKPTAPKPAHKPFKAYEPGYLHMDVKYLPQMADEERRRYLFVAIDRATRWVFVRIYPAKTAANARRFLRDLDRAAPMKITRVLTDNGKEFTDRLFGLRKRAATGNHEFDRLCAELAIEHRLAPPMRPQTNGMVERFNGRIEDVLQSHRFRSGEELEQTILRYVRLYNSQLPQSVLKGRTPIDTLKDWHRNKPELFKKRPYNHAGCDIYRMLNNRAYIGEAVHKGESYPGEHDAIIDRETWDRVHAILQESPRKRAMRTRAETPAPLKGLLFGPDGAAFSPTHTRKGDRLYRYYVSQTVLKHGAGSCPIARVSAGEIEAAVIDQLRAVFRQPEIVASTWKAARAHADDITEADARTALQQIDPLWDELFPAEQARIVALLVERVDIGTDGLNVRLRVDGLGSLAREMLADNVGAAA